MSSGGTSPPRSDSRYPTPVLRGHFHSSKSLSPLHGPNMRPPPTSTPGTVFLLSVFYFLSFSLPLYSERLNLRPHFLCSPSHFPLYPFLDGCPPFLFPVFLFLLSCLPINGRLFPKSFVWFPARSLCSPRCLRPQEYLGPRSMEPHTATLDHPGRLLR
jgi:hypothetical protein